VTLLVRSPHKVEPIFGPEITRRLAVVCGDMTDAGAVQRALHDQQALVHAAAVVALERKHAARVLHDNRRGVEVVIGGAIEAGIERMLYVSSAVALFCPGAASLTLDAPVSDGATAYTRSKAECEMYLRTLQDRGAPIRITYPGGVIGPDDPGLSAANHAVLTVFRDTAVVTDSGLQMVDVRDVARAHVRLLAAASAPGRHLLNGHFLAWGTLVDLMEDITERKLQRLPIPGAVLRAAGVVADVIKRVWDFPFPLTHEAARIMTQWPPLAVGDEMGGSFRDPRETLRDTLLWLHAAGHLRVDALGALRRHLEYPH